LAEDKTRGRGRPVQYDDPYHVITRKLAQDYRARKADETVSSEKVNRQNKNDLFTSMMEKSTSMMEKVGNEINLRKKE